MYQLFHNSYLYFEQSSKMHIFQDDITNGLCGRNFHDLKWMECMNGKEYTKEEIIEMSKNSDTTICKNCLKKLKIQETIMKKSKEIKQDVTYKVIDEQSKFYGKELQYAHCSSLDDWSAVILYTSEPDSNGLRDSQVFRANQVVRVGAK